MDLYERVKVEFPCEETFYKHAQGDVWDAVFEPCEATTLIEAPADVVVEFPKNTYTGANAGNAYGREDGWRDRLNGHFLKLRVRGEVRELASQVHEGMSEAVAVMYRGDNFLSREQRTGILPTPENMSDEVEALGKKGPVFVAADSWEATERFRDRLGNRVVYWVDGERCEKMGQSVYGRRPGITQIQKALALGLALSNAKHFVHAVSNMATAVLYMNSQLPHTFVERSKASQ